VYASLCAVLFGLPLARAFRAGIESAREPVHRVTPEDPWVFFRRRFRSSLGRTWPVIWFAVFAGLAVVGRGQDMAFPPMAALAWNLQFVSYTLAMFLLIWAACHAFASLVANTFALTLLATICACVALITLAGFLDLVLPRSLTAIHTHQDLPPPAGVTPAVIPILYLHVASAAALVLFAAHVTARRLGARWFRFED
jgi:hypothetical protein